MPSCTVTLASTLRDGVLAHKARGAWRTLEPVHRRLALPVALALAGLATATSTPAATRLPGFRSPSGNIKCLFVPGRPSTMLCHIGEAVYVKALQEHCAAPPIELDWAGFTLPAARRGGVSCSGGILYSPDTQVPTYVTLPYGRSWRHGVFTCRSRITGVTCASRAGHGLFLSRQSWRAW
jgi:hypothetical protein